MTDTYFPIATKYLNEDWLDSYDYVWDDLPEESQPKLIKGMNSLPPLEGLKFDTDKVRYELLPPEFLEATAEILTFGAKKYADRNWEKGMNWSRVYGALMRHLWAWWAKKGTDPDTGKSHLWHAACCIAFLLTYEARSIGNDDRP